MSLRMRKKIAKAREDLVKAQKETEARAVEMVEKGLYENDERLEKENKEMRKQTWVYQTEIMGLEARKEALNLQNDVLSQAQPQVPPQVLPQGLSQVLQRMDDLKDEKEVLERQLAKLSDKFDSTEGDKRQFEVELEQTLQEQDGLRQQLEEMDDQKLALINEHGSAVKAVKDLRAQLGRIGTEKVTLETNLSSATKHSASLEQQLTKLEPEQNALIEQLKTAH